MQHAVGIKTSRATSYHLMEGIWDAVFLTEHRWAGTPTNTFIFI